MRWPRRTLNVSVRIRKKQGPVHPNPASRRVGCEPPAQFPAAELTATFEADRYLARFGPTLDAASAGRFDRSAEATAFEGAYRYVSRRFTSAHLTASDM